VKSRAVGKGASLASARSEGTEKSLFTHYQLIWNFCVPRVWYRKLQWRANLTTVTMITIYARDATASLFSTLSHP
jgi:hypothetical protein